MRAHASLMILCLAGAAFAEPGVLGTKQESISAPAGTGQGAGLGVMPLLQMALALGIVMLLLKFVLPKFVGKMNKKLVTSATSVLSVEESASFAGGTLYIVRARSKTLLLSVASQGVTCLADITESESAPVQKTTFETLLDAAPGDKAPEPIEELDPQPEPVVAEPTGQAVIEERLERLARLAG